MNTKQVAADRHTLSTDSRHKTACTLQLCTHHHHPLLLLLSRGADAEGT